MSDVESRPHCNVKPRTVRALPPGLPANRLQLIRMLASKWVNGTVLHYFFVGGPEPQRQAVRDAFAEWKGLPIGLEFVEVSDRSEAEVRIGFDQADGSWSYVGRDILGIGASESTMNFGWDLTDDYGHTTALHEIGHTLGLRTSTRTRLPESPGTRTRSMHISRVARITGAEMRPSRTFCGKSIPPRWRVRTGIQIR